MSRNRSAEDILTEYEKAEAAKRPKNHSTTSLPNYEELMHLNRHENDKNSQETICEEVAAQQSKPKIVEDLEERHVKMRRDSFEVF